MPNDPAADPYRYGLPATPPPQPVIARDSSPTGRELLRATWKMLEQDRSMIGLSVVAAMSTLAAFAVLFVPGLILLHGHEDNRFTVWLILAVATLPSTLVGLYFQAAITIGAFQRAEGNAPTFNGVLTEAWRYKWRILSWGAVTTTVGLVVRAVEQRLGIFGRFLGILGGLTWAAGSFFVVPALIADDLGPMKALKQSVNVIKTTWRTSVRTTLRFGAISLITVVPLIAAIAGFVMLSDPNSTTAARSTGVLLFAVGMCTVFFLGALFSAVTNYARALIYRYATARPVPGIEPALFDGAFAPRRRGRRR